MKWLLIEAFTPDDVDILNSNSDKKYTPTEEFLRNAYLKLNKRFFGGKLPNDIEFKIERRLEDEGAGHTDADDNEVEGEFNIHYVSLNGTLMMTIHSWIETILHEMIHVNDFIYHSEHFNKKINPTYKPHEGWFMKEADKFKKFGYNIKETVDSDMETSVDNDDIKNKMNGIIYMRLGHNPVFNCDTMIKVKMEDKNDVLQELKGMKCSSIDIITTENPASARLNITEPDNVGQMSYNMTDKFNKIYGPFTKVETIDLSKVEIDESVGKTIDILHLYPGFTIAEILPNGKRHFRT